MKEYKDIDWNKVGNHLENLMRIQCLKMNELIDAAKAEQWTKAAKEKLAGFLEEN